MTVDFSKIASIAGGFAEARAVQVGVKMGLFDALASEPRDAESLARAIKANPQSTGLLANALAALGLLEKHQSVYSLTPSARRYLVESSPEYLGGMILFDESLWTTWGELEHTVASGRPARTPDMFQSRPEETARFIRAMDSLVRARGDARWVADHLDLSGVETIADVGGGPGTYLVAMTRRWPRLRAAIYDLPATLKVARQILADRDPSALERIDFREVDYLTAELPGPVGAIFMSNIIHGEDFPTNQALMAKCFRALRPGGLIAIKDHIMSAEMTEPVAGAVFSLYLMLVTRGRDYSFDEVGGWLEAAGFAEVRIETLPSPPFTSSIVLARKP